MLDDPERVHKLSDRIIKHFGHQAFQGKSILDLGSGNGDLIVCFARLGAAQITCVDARKENLDIITKKYPFIKTIQADLDNSWPFENQRFNFVFSLGLLNHLKHFDKHIRDITSIAEDIVLECEVLDLKDNKMRIPVYEPKTANWLSANGEGSIVSAINIQEKLSDLCATFKRMDDRKLNNGDYTYDWLERGIGRKFGNRRFYFIRKDRFWETKQPKIVHSSANDAPPIVNTPERPTPRTVEELRRPDAMYRRPPPPATPRPRHQVREAPPSAMPQGQLPRMRLFFNYYADSNPERKREIDLCLQKNIDNPAIEIIILAHDTVPTFNFYFEKINRITGADDINIICNSDIFFDQTITQAARIGGKEVYALSRWDWSSVSQITYTGRNNSQDAWIVKGKVEGVNGDFLIGKPFSDNRIAYEFQKAGYIVSNPSRTIKAYHIHNSGIRHFSEGDGIAGEKLFVEPTGL